ELQTFVTRFKGKASKARQAQSKMKQINRMEKDLVKPLYSSRAHPKISFSCCRPSGKTVLEVKSVSKAYGAKKVLNNVSFTLDRGDRLAVIGPNGIGKSTLLKIIMDELAADQGDCVWGYETYPEYFSQDHKDLIPNNSSPYEYLYNYGPAESISSIRGHLGNLLFSGDDVHKTTAALSGGEAARLVIAKLVLKKGNVLVLDEPTNHLDLESIETFIDALVKFDGTIIFVSHNRYLVNRLATRVLELKADGFDLYPGTYTEYLEHLGYEHLSGDDPAKTKASPTRMRELKKQESDTEKSGQPAAAAQTKTQNRNQPQDKIARKKLNQQLKPLKKESSIAEKLCEDLEKENENFNRMFSQPDYYSNTSPETIKKQAAAKKECEEKLSWAYNKWEKLNQEIEILKEQLI
ncbi:MAG: ATP-binding cassette domain-containing protein, partial [Deltaproteobacteria bacterium]|nr:ATP-binding cassette domain-containing protein [Deltaproteobacteria bacterium]